MSTRIRIIHRIIPAIRIQVQLVSAVGVLLGEPPDHGVVIPGPQVLLLADGIVLLAVELKTVLYLFLAESQVPPCVIFVAVKDILPSYCMGYTPHLVRDIVVVCPDTVRARGDQIIAPDIAGHALLLLQLGHHFLAQHSL